MDKEEKAIGKNRRLTDPERLRVVFLLQTGNSIDNIVKIIGKNKETIKYEIGRYIQGERDKGYDDETIAKFLRLTTDSINEVTAVNTDRKRRMVDESDLNQLKSKCKKLEDENSTLKCLNKHLEIKISLEISKSKKLQFELNKIHLENFISQIED